MKLLKRAFGNYELFVLHFKIENERIIKSLPWIIYVLQIIQLQSISTKRLISEEVSSYMARL